MFESLVTVPVWGAEEKAVFESGAVARVRRLLCLRAWGQRLSVE
jgi:hypothetical protein